jgi:adenylate cyclase
VWEALEDTADIGESGQFQGSFAGQRRLKGIKNEVGLYRVRRGRGSSGSGGSDDGD